MQNLQVLLGKGLLEVPLIASHEEETQFVIQQLYVVVVEVGCQLIRLVFIGTTMPLQVELLNDLIDLLSLSEVADLQWCLVAGGIPYRTETYCGVWEISLQFDLTEEHWQLVVDDLCIV